VKRDVLSVKIGFFAFEQLAQRGDVLIGEATAVRKVRSEVGVFLFDCSQPQRQGSAGRH